MNYLKYSPDWIPPPGATIENVLRNDTGSKRAVLCEAVGSQIESLLSGEREIDQELAKLLERSLGLADSFWLERERLYRKKLLSREQEVVFLKNLPLRDMAPYSDAHLAPSHCEKIHEVVKFFGMENADECQSRIETLVATARQKASVTFSSIPESLAAWIRMGEITVAKQKYAPLNLNRIDELLPVFRGLTRIEEPARFLPRLTECLNSCGVLLAVVKPPSGCTARGVVKFLNSDTVMILLSGRHLSNDHLWFSFFHELAHLILRHVGTKDEYVDDSLGDSLSEMERLADSFAADVLIPSHHRREFKHLKDARSIVKFAQNIGIARGVVVGQMQRANRISYSEFNSLKVYYEWSEERQLVARKRT